MNNNNRPLSPHLQVYRPQITSVLSITHRITGVGLSLGVLMLTYWLYAMASGEETFINFYILMNHFIMRLFLFGMLWSLCFHLLNGVRHLCWDALIGIDMKSATRSGWFVVIASVLAATVLWLLAARG